MSVIFVGGLPPEGETVLVRYLKQYLPEATIDYLKAAGIKGKIKNFGKNSDVLLIVIEEALYNLCSNVAQEVLELPKVHKYTSVDRLNEFLISKFGRLGDSFIEEEKQSPVSVSSIEEKRIVDVVETENLVVTAPDKDIEEELRGIIATRNSIIENLKSQIAELSQDFCTESYDSKEKELEQVIETCKAQISDLEQKILELEATISKEVSFSVELLAVKEDLKISREAIADLQHTNETLNTGADASKKENLDLTLKVMDFENKLKDLKIVCGDLLDGKKAVEVENLSLQEQTKAIEEKLIGLEISIKASYESEKLELTEEKNVILAELDSKRAAVAVLDSLVLEKDNKLQVLIESERVTSAKLDEALATSESLLKDMIVKQSDLTVIDSSAESLIDTLLERIDTLKTNVSEIEASKAVAEKHVDEITASYNEKIDNYDTELDTTKQRAIELETELGECIKTRDTLSAELEVTKARLGVLTLELEEAMKDLNTQKSDNIAVADTLSRVESELVEKVKSSTDISELTASQEKVDALLEENTNLKLGIEELESSVFTQISNIALPKSVSFIKLPLEDQGFDNMRLVASGSGDSVSSLYKFLKQQAMFCENKSVIILDLVTDSYIDVEFGAERLLSPISWLDGSASVDSVKSKTAFDNIQIISTAFSYFNEVYLLNVDWDKKLRELKKSANIIIINVGVVDSIVHNTLFYTLSERIKGYVLVKATPISMRAALLHMLGFVDIKNTEILCSDYIEEHSKVMYKRLSERFTTRCIDANTSII